MQKDPLAATKARKAERKADEKSGLISIKPVKIDLGSGTSASTTGFKKGGFKSAFGSGEDTKDRATDTPKTGNLVNSMGTAAEVERLEEDTDEEYEYYDPARGRLTAILAASDDSSLESVAARQNMFSCKKKLCHRLRLVNIVEGRMNSSKTASIMYLGLIQNHRFDCRAPPPPLASEQSTLH